VSRVVVRVAGITPDDSEPEQIFVSLDDAPFAIPDAERLHPFACSADLMERFNAEPPAVRQVGETLLGRLGEHPAVADAMTMAMGIAPTDCCPLYLRLIGSESAGEYPWETLFAPQQGFLALEGRWPIARIAAQQPRERDVRTFAPPLRVMAVMSAVGVPAAEEWGALRSAIADAHLSLELELSIHVGELELKEQIELAMAEDGIAGTVTMLSDTPALLAAISHVDPHILHLFCHGTGGAAPMLQLATRRDHAVGQGSSIVLEPLQLRGVGHATWVVTLNCCEGGSDAEGARSLASLLISAGYPATVGMREPVASAHAAVFARGFYTSLLRQIDERLQPGEEAELELAAALVDPRRALRDLHREDAAAAECHREWTLPVLYVRPDPLRIARVKADPTHSASERKRLTDFLDTLLRYSAQMPADTPQAVRDRIEAEVQKTLLALETAA